MILFGITEIVFSQIPNFNEVWWLSIVAAVMSFTYSAIGLSLGVAQVVRHGRFQGSPTGISTGPGVTQTQKIWHSFQAIGDIAFAYSYSTVLVEIQDTIKSPPPSEAKVMKRATVVSVAVTTLFYTLCGSMGYAAFGDAAPGNLLTGFGFYSPYWLLDIANAAIVIHLVGAYQVFCQPLFAFVEKWARERWPESELIRKEFSVPISKTKKYKLSLFRLTWRTTFVVLTTLLAMMLPFFNDIVGLMGGSGFLAIDGVLSGGDVYRAEEGEEVEHQVGVFAGAERLVSSYIGGGGHRLGCRNRRCPQGLQAIEEQILICSIGSYLFCTSYNQMHM
ncbi:hypothetical protein HPP92_000097 [Vanilla planifolia]|uniref:Amino acid transporter transmembrane domain-containing protein n=1 Tax=Vanilla planifolia TaxID=51239 RepID=A0A835S467_VANPL|nr:hypothetical protein HPP92_000097 [Vanilla planifolia]